MKKYLRLFCTVCKRTTDRLVEPAHYTPDKCTITLKCEGRLTPVQYLSNGGITSQPEVGLTDWYPRGTVLNTGSTPQDTTFLDTSTGETQQIVLAVQVPSDPGPGSTLQLTLNQRNDTPKAFRQYVFRREGTFSSISGVESGLEKKTLRYSVTDTVEVFLNGVKLELGLNPEDYQIFDGVAAVPPNTVNFNTPISLPGITQVDVIVSQAASTTEIELTFNRNINDESRVNTGAWENVDSVLTFNGTWTPLYLFTLDLADGTALNLNTILTASSTALINGSIVVPIQNISLLLARAPFSTLDRYTSITVPMSTLTFERDYLKYFAVNGAPVLYVTNTAVSPVYPLLRVQRFNVESTIQTALDGVTNQIVVDGNVIVGPDT